jgi:hypothetical protein
MLWVRFWEQTRFLLIFCSVGVADNPSFQFRVIKCLILQLEIKEGQFFKGTEA